MFVCCFEIKSVCVLLRDQECLCAKREIKSVCVLEGDQECLCAA